MAAPPNAGQSRAGRTNSALKRMSSRSHPSLNSSIRAIGAKQGVSSLLPIRPWNQRRCFHTIAITFAAAGPFGRSLRGQFAWTLRVNF
jgi:hypothetical protein